MKKSRIELDFIEDIGKRGERRVSREMWQFLYRGLRATARAGCPESRFWTDFVFGYSGNYYSWLCSDRRNRHFLCMIEHGWDIPF